MIEPSTKRVFAFIDGQNLYHSAKAAFGHPIPNYEPMTLAVTVCGQRQNWDLKKVYFYTGVPDPTDNARWSAFWASKLLAMSRRGVETFSRPLRYRNKTINVGGTQFAFQVAEEKGIDVRLALDVIRFGIRQAYDVALIFSQDQDLSEVADDIRAIAIEQGRWIKVASAFPSSPASASRFRGINGTDWIRVDRATYDGCLDPRSHFPVST